VSKDKTKSSLPARINTHRGAGESHSRHHLVGGGAGDIRVLSTDSRDELAVDKIVDHTILAFVEHHAATNVGERVNEVCRSAARKHKTKN